MVTKDRQFDYYMPPCFCHDRHKTVAEFILILDDQMWKKNISTFTDVQPARTFCILRSF